MGYASSSGIRVGPFHLARWTGPHSKVRQTIDVVFATPGNHRGCIGSVFLSIPPIEFFPTAAAIRCCVCRRHQGRSTETPGTGQLPLGHCCKWEDRHEFSNTLTGSPFALRSFARRMRSLRSITSLPVLAPGIHSFHSDRSGLRDRTITARTAFQSSVFPGKGYRTKTKMVQDSSHL